MKGAEACIGLCVLCKRNLNKKIGGVKHEEVTLLLALILLDLELL